MKRLLVMISIASVAGCDGCAGTGPATLTLKGRTITVEWVDKDPDRRWLPSAHSPLTDGRGILMSYGEDRIMHHCTLYTEKQTKFGDAGYDVVWLSKDGKVVDVATLPTKSFEGVTSRVEAYYALFLPDGWAKAHSLSAGDLCSIPSMLTRRRPEPLPELKVGGVSINVEMATKAEERERGFMHRTKVSDHDGMLFVYPSPGRHSFWMLHCHVPLDIAFFDKDGRFLNVVPINTYPDPNVDPGQFVPGGRAVAAGDAKYVLEVNRGWFVAKGLTNDKNQATKPITLELSKAAAEAAKEAK